MTTRKIPISVDLDREDKAINCPCGGYAERVKCTPAEIEEWGCGRRYECCARAFVCVICKTRYVGCAPAPDM